MGEIFFYSDQIIEPLGNQRLDNILLDGMDIKNVKIGYIPSAEDKERTNFNNIEIMEFKTLCFLTFIVNVNHRRLKNY